MKKVRFPEDLKDPSTRRLCSECPRFTDIRCIICKDYTCTNCIEIDTKCYNCVFTELVSTISRDNHE